MQAQLTHGTYVNFPLPPLRSSPRPSSLRLSLWLAVLVAVCGLAVRVAVCCAVLGAVVVVVWMAVPLPFPLSPAPFLNYTSGA